MYVNKLCCCFMVTLFNEYLESTFPKTILLLLIYCKG